MTQSTIENLRKVINQLESIKDENSQDLWLCNNLMFVESRLEKLCEKIEITSELEKASDSAQIVFNSLLKERFLLFEDYKSKFEIIAESINTLIKFAASDNIAVNILNAKQYELDEFHNSEGQFEMPELLPIYIQLIKIQNYAVVGS